MTLSIPSAEVRKYDTTKKLAGQGSMLPPRVVMLASLTVISTMVLLTSTTNNGVQAASQVFFYPYAGETQDGSAGVPGSAPVAFGPQSSGMNSATALYLRFRRAGLGIAAPAEEMIPVEDSFVQPFMRFRKSSPASPLEQKKLYNLAQLRAMGAH